MGSFESKPVSADEQLKKFKREISRSVRELDREVTKLERTQDKTYADMKKALGTNQEKILRLKAKDWARTKKTIEKFYVMRTHMTQVELQLQTIKSTNAMTKGLKDAVGAMQKMSKTMNVPALSNMLQSFAHETGMLEANQEMINGEVDSVMGSEDDIGEQDAVVAGIIEELKQSVASGARPVPTGAMGAGLGAPVAAAPMPTAMGMGGGAPSAPAAGAGTGAPPGAGGQGGGGSGGSAADALQARLNNLKKD